MEESSKMSVPDPKEEKQKEEVMASPEEDSTKKSTHTEVVVEACDDDRLPPATDEASPTQENEQMQPTSTDASAQESCMENGKKEVKQTEKASPAQKELDNDAQKAPEDSGANSEVNEVENLKKQVAKLKSELKETKSQLESFKNLSHKLEGLVGSLKSVILFLDPVKGKRVLQVEIARLERVLFPASTTTNKGKKKKSKKKKKDKAENTNKKTSSQTDDTEKETKAVRKAAPAPPCEIGDDGEPIMMALEDTMEGGRPTTPPSSKQTLPSPLHYSPSKPQSHPRATDAAYWKEFSTQAAAANEQAAQLERIMKQKQKQSKSWGIGSLFSSP